MAEPVLKFQVDVGVLVAGDIKAQVQRYCFLNDLSCDFQDFGGFFTKKLAFIIKGDRDKLSKAKTDLGTWVKKLEVGI